MLNALKFVKGSVSSKDILPALTHFVIEQGTVRGYNGIIALCSPIPFGLSCKPRAEPLVKAIANCTETVQLTLTATGRLSIHSGKFRAYVDCIEGETPHVKAEGTEIQINGQAILDAFKRLQNFIGTDASRPWCEGVLLDQKSAFATNNIILVEYWLGCDIPVPICVPKMAIKEMVRINEPPVSALLKDNSITFLYEGGRWIRSQLLDTSWPDIRKILDIPCNPQTVDVNIFEGLQIIKPFADKGNKVFFNDTVMSTHEIEGEGAQYNIVSLMPESSFTIDMLQLLEGTAKQVDWTTYPKPCPFFGDKIRGVIVGLKK